MSNTVNKVSINRIIGNVIGNLRLKNTNNLKDDFARWACEAENKIGSTTSYKRHECELTIRNRKAALPPNFAYLNAIKHGNKIINTTKRSFRLFNKGTNSPIIPESNLINGNKVIDKPGVPLSIAVSFAGAFIAGDIITVTITSNNCGNIVSQTYTYVVQPGDTLTMIAAEINNQINAIINIGYTSSPGNDQFIVSGDSPEVNFNVSLFTDSSAGSLSQSIVQKRVPSKKNTVDLSSSNKNPILQSKNLANSSVAKLNTGLSANVGNGSTGGYAWNYDTEPTDQVFSIDNGCINFNAYDDTKIGISYMGIDVDDEGWPLISELHEDAVTHYIMYMYKSADFWSGKMNAGVYDRLEGRWFDLCSQARGDDELPNSEEMKYYTNVWMQLIPLPSKENF